MGSKLGISSRSEPLGAAAMAIDQPAPVARTGRRHRISCFRILIKFTVRAATGGADSSSSDASVPSSRQDGARRGLTVGTSMACFATGLLLALAPSAYADVTHFREPQTSFPFAEPHSPDGLGFDQTNQFVYVATQSHNEHEGTILKYDASGKPANFSALSSPELVSQRYLNQLTVDGAGNIYVVSGGIPGAVYKYLPTGEPDPTTPEIGASILKVPDGIAVSESGDVYVTSGNANQQSNGEGLPVVDVFSPTGALERSIGGTALSELEPKSIAIDSAGTVYVAAGSGGGYTGAFGSFAPKEGGVFAFEEDGTCLDSCHPIAKGDPLSVAVEPGTDRLFIDMEVRPHGEEPPGSAKDIITEYESFAHGNAELGSFTAPDLENNAPNMSVDGATGRVYVGDLYGGENGEGHVAVFGPSVIVPTLTTTQVSNIQQTSATVNGTVSTAGTEPATALTVCHFDYITEASFKANHGFSNLSSGGEVPCVPAASSVPNDGLAHAVDASVTGLTPATAYRFQLVAANEKDEGEFVRERVGESFTTAAPPRVDVQGAEELEPAAAKLHAKINPFVFDTSAHFEYITEKAFQENHESFSGVQNAASTSVKDLGPGTGDKSIEETISGLQPETTYHFRVVATNSAGTVDGPTQIFTTLTPALVDTLLPKAIKPSEATLQVYLNPEGQETTYHFEYGTAETYGHSSPSADVGPGHEPTLGSTSISDLQPNTTYHFRTVASNSFGTVEGPDTTFTTPPTSCPNEKTRTGLSARLTECRAYEQISPINKDGNGAQTTSVSADGERAVVQLLGNGLPGAQSAPVFDTYLSERGPAGWSTVGVDPPARTGKFPAITWATNTDLSKFAGQIDHTNNIAGEGGIDSGAATLRNLNGSIEEFALESSDGNLWSNGGAPIIEGATSDLSHLLYSSGQQLMPSDPQHSGPNRWYDLTGLGGPSPSLSLVSVEANGTPLSESPRACGGVSTDHEIGSPISSDGSKVFFETHIRTNGGGCNVAFEARVNGAKTAVLTEPETNDGCTTTACLNSPGEPAGATADSANGSKFFFEDAQQLTNNATEINSGPRFDPLRERFVSDSHGESETMCKEVEWQTLRRVNGCNLYEYDFERPEGHSLIDITAERDMSGYGPQVHDVVRASADGSHVYFVSGGVLTPQPNALGQAAVPSAENLYGYDTETGTMKFVAQVCSHRAEVPGGSSGPFGEIISGVPPDPKCHSTGEDESTQSIEFSRLREHSDVTPDGRYLVFAAYPQLTPDDTNEARDVYRYDFQTGSLIRLSVGHDGEDENGNGGGQDADVAAPGAGLLKGGPEIHDVSSDGQTVAFTTARPLQSTDTSEQTEVYVWHQGEVSLISGGEDPIGSHSPYVTPSGRDIFFSTTQGLLPQDNDHVTDAYDARVDGGFPPAPPAPPVCEGGEACHGTPGAGPAAPTLGTESFRGPPNESEELPVRKCSNKRFIHKDGKCVKKPSKRQKKHHGRGARHRRGGGK